MEAEDVPSRAEAAGERLRGALEATKGVAQVRGLGLLLAAELTDGDAKAVAGRLLDREAAGLVVNAVTPTALRFAPPLLVSDEEIGQAVAMLDEALNG
jgi:acetylornithine aminotransferase